MGDLINALGPKAAHAAVIPQDLPAAALSRQLAHTPTFQVANDPAQRDIEMYFAHPRSRETMRNYSAGLGLAFSGDREAYLADPYNAAWGRGDPSEGYQYLPHEMRRDDRTPEWVAQHEVAHILAEPVVKQLNIEPDPEFVAELIVANPTMDELKAILKGKSSLKLGVGHIEEKDLPMVFADMLQGVLGTRAKVTQSKDKD